MAEGLVSVVLDQLASWAREEVQKEVRLVCGVKKEIKSLSDTLRTIQAVINDAEQKQVTDKVVKEWLQRLKLVVYDIEDLLDELNTKVLRSQIKARFHKHHKGIKFFRFRSPFKSLVQRHKIGKGIKEQRQRLEEIARDQRNYGLREKSNALEMPQQEITSSVVDVSEIYGRNDEKDVLMSKLLNECSSQDGGVPIICVVGMGGLGKTNLSQSLFNEPKIMDQFENRIWVCVSDPFDKEKVAKAIIEGIGGSASNASQWDTLHRDLCDVLKNKRFLLVLDDVWTEKHAEWEPIKVAIKGGAPGSRILVTTRNKQVAKMMNATYVHPLRELPQEYCWSLFSIIAFAGRDEEERLMLRETGMKMVEKCKGVPLFVKTLAGAMHFKRKEDWEDVLKSDTWEVPEVAEGVLPALLLSYYSLPPNLKRCFEFCAIFPKDHKLKRDELIRLWMAHGFLKSNDEIGIKENMEKRGKDYFDNLVMRSLLQDVEEKLYNYGFTVTQCKMHDLVHDLAQYLTLNKSFVIERNGTSEMISSEFAKVSGNFHHQMIMMEHQPEDLSSFLYNEMRKKKHLRTLKLGWSHYSPSLVAVDPNLFFQLTCLRALDLSGCRGLKSLNEVENLIHLRFLDLSSTDLKKLPKTLSNLCNLQTLRLCYCHFLEELPQGIGNMISLRHLENGGTDSLTCMPEGMGQLGNLRTLSMFVASNGSKAGSCKLRELKHLNLLQGLLVLSGLEKVANFEEAKEANLMKKEHLIIIDLEFKTYATIMSECEQANEGEDEMERLDSVLEGLQLHPNVKRLSIRHYNGSKFPSWMMDTSSMLMYSQLKHLYLFECNNCTELPPLGKLQPLETLEISGMKSIKHIGQEFWGIPDMGDHWEISSSTSTRRGSSSSSSRSAIVFPKLKELTFFGMKVWEDWEVVPQPTVREETNKEDISGGGDQSGEIINCKNIISTNVRITMPCLELLSLWYCPKLKSMPLNISSQTPWKFNIRRCPELTQKPIPTQGMAQLQVLAVDGQIKEGFVI